MSVAAWWLVLNDESRRNAEIETHQQTALLIDEIAAHEVTSKDLQDARIAAERANDAKSRYVIGISHELRTPLNSILGYSQLLQKQEQLSEQGKMALGVISRSGQHLTSLIDGLLDLARIETGKISLNVVDVHFPNFIEQIIQMFQPQFEQKNLQFVYEIEITYRTMSVPTKTLRTSAHQFAGQCFKVYNEWHNYFKSRVPFSNGLF